MPLPGLIIRITECPLLIAPNPDGTPVDQRVEVRYEYSFGERVIRTMRYPEPITMNSEGQLLDGSDEVLNEFEDLIVSEQSYYESDSELPGAYTGKLADSVGPDGAWSIYEYDSQGRRSKTIRQYKDSEYGDEAASEVTEFDYVVPAALASSGVDFRESVKTVAGVEVSRRYRVIVRDPATRHHLEHWNIVATEAGAVWDDSTNLVTKTFFIPEGQAFAGKVDRRENADGTETRYNYSVVSGDYQTVEETGPVDGSNSISEGIRTTTLTAMPSGTVMQRTREDIASGLTLDSMTVLDTDHFARATTVAYGDGSLSERSYAPLSCGCGSDKVVSETDRRGITTTYDYDALGRRTSMTRLGVTETYELDAQGRTVRVTRSSGGESQIVGETDYDLAGRVTERRAPGPVTDGSLLATTTGYAYPSEGGQVVTTTHPDGGTEIRSSYPDGQTRTILGTAVAPMKMAYGTFTEGADSGLFTRQIRLLDDPQTPGDYLETEWTESRSVMGRRHSTVFPDGASLTVAYDDKGRVIEQVDPDGVTTRFAYDDRGRRTVTAVKTADTSGIDYANDRVTETEHAVIQKTADLGAGAQSYTFQQTNTYVYNEENDATSRTLMSTSEREAFGRGSLRTDASGAESRSYRTAAVDGDWEEVSVAPSGAYSVRGYIGGLLDAESAFDADDSPLAQTTYGYDGFNRRSSATDSRSGTTAFAYYDNDQVREIIAPDPDGDVLDTQGTVVQHPDGDGVHNPLVTLMTYDSMGRETQRHLPDASVVYSEYNPRGQLAKQYGSQTNPVEYGYDAQGRQISMTTWQDFDVGTGSGISGAATTTWIYDPQRGWLDRKEYEDGEGTDYIYTPGGRLASRTWARGVATHYAYNLAGDLLAVDYDDANATPDVLYSYTRTGQQDEVKDGQFTTNPFTAGAILATAPSLNATRYTYAYGYGAEQQLETETVSDLLTVDAVLTRNYQDGTETNGLAGRSSGYALATGGPTLLSSAYAYDTAGRLESVSDGTDTFTYGYLANTRNQLETMTGPVHTVIYSYEPGRNAMTQVENKETVGTASVVSNYAYTYNELGQRDTREQSFDDATTVHRDAFAYDYLGQVTGSTNDTLTGDAWNPSYAYDEIGNRAGATVDFNGSVTYTPNLLNQYSAISASSAVNPTYDSDGNLTSDGGNWSYTWNGENRLVNADNGTVSIDFEYDYQGRLVKKDDGTSEEIYLYDGWNRIATFEPQVSGLSPKVSYLWGLDLSGSMQGAGGVGGLLKEGARYPTCDANGNIVQKLNSNGGTDMAVAYDPFGNVIDGVLVGEYGFSTKPLVDDLNWYYYGFRYYDPETGRWLSRDPIGENGGLNLYGMLDNDLINAWDYLGLTVITYEPKLVSGTDRVPPPVSGITPGEIQHAMGAAVSIYATDTSLTVNAFAYAASTDAFTSGVASITCDRQGNISYTPSYDPGSDDFDVQGAFGAGVIVNFQEPDLGITVPSEQLVIEASGEAFASGSFSGVTIPGPGNNTINRLVNILSAFSDNEELVQQNVAALYIYECKCVEGP